MSILKLCATHRLAILWAVVLASPALGQDSLWTPYVEQARSQGRHPSLVVEDAYRSILAAHAQRDSRAALDALQDLENRFWDSPGSACFEKVRRQTLDALGEAAPESLLPVLALYVSLWTENVESPRLGKARLGKAMATRALLEDYLEVYVRGDVPESAAVASRLLVHWARLMSGVGFLVLTQGSTEIFELALVHDPANKAALEAGSMIYERFGEYKLALALLERRLETDPENAVVRLRVALNRLRTGAKAHVADAAAELDALAHGDAEPWVRILAYQELAAHHGERDRHAEALGTAREAREQFPDNEHVAVQLAFLLNDDSVSLSGSPQGGDAGTTLAEQTLDDWRGDGGENPRLVYEESPEAAARAMTMLHAADVGRRLPELAAALEHLRVPDDERQSFGACNGKLKLLQ